MDLDSLSYELNLYEKGDYNTLERILSPSQTAIPTDPSQTVGDEVDDISIITSQEPSQLSNKVRVRKATQDQLASAVNGDQVQTQEQTTTEISIDNQLTVEKRTEIGQLTKKWIKIETTLEKLKEVKKELEREKKTLDQQLLEDIETYRLTDITKGSHQLIPKINKGRKKPLTKKIISDKLTDFLNTKDVTDEVDELVIQAIDYLDNTRDKSQDNVRLKHVRIKKSSSQ